MRVECGMLRPEEFRGLSTSPLDSRLLIPLLHPAGVAESPTTVEEVRPPSRRWVYGGGIFESAVWFDVTIDRIDGGYSSAAERLTVAQDVVGSIPTSRPK